METVKLAKLAATPVADEALDRMVKSTNEGFTAGRLTKTELLSWAILYFENHSFERCVEKIREAHFDQVAYLESVVREMKGARKSGTGGTDLAALLAPLTVGKPVPQPRKRAPASTESSPSLAKKALDNE